MEKRCKVCKDEKPLDEFHKHLIALDGRQNTCKSCKKQLDQKRYQTSNKREQSNEYRFGIIQKLIEIKTRLGCKYCEEYDPVALDFHHEKDDKEDHVSRLAWDGSGTRALAEAMKCEVICSNHHRKIHAGQALAPRR